MKILSYNISWSKQEKIDWLLGQKGIDAYVVPECGNADNIAVPEGYSFFWTGDFDYKGLGVICPDNHKIVLPDWYNENLHYAIPVIFDDEYLLLAVWPTVRKGITSGSYISILLDILEYYKPYINKYKTVVIGDYNVISNPNSFQRKESPKVFAWFEENGLKSAHHTFLHEEIGKESRFTYDHTGKGNCTFFLDYAFTNTEVKDYKLYSWEESNRMSDHLPICVEV
ncbi:MAG: hypothetical protein EGR68_00655 [Prevotella copri]|nr:hypothetical protein [Segatella copri]